MPNRAVNSEHYRLTIKEGTVANLSQINNLAFPGNEYTWTALNGAENVTIDNEVGTIVASKYGIYNIKGTKDGAADVTISVIVPHEDYLDHMVGGIFMVNETPSLTALTYKGDNGGANKYIGKNTFDVPVTNSSFKYSIPDTYNFRVTLKGNDIAYYVAPNGTVNYSELYNSATTPLTAAQNTYMDASNKKTGTISLYSNGWSRAFFKSVSVSLDFESLPESVSLGVYYDENHRNFDMVVGEVLELSNANFEVDGKYYHSSNITFTNVPTGITVINGESIIANADGIYRINANIGEEINFAITITVGESYWGIEYKLYDNYVEITDYIDYSGELIIPSIIEGYPVTSIGDYAFSNCTSLTSVIIPDNVTNIGNYAFNGCSSLTSVNMPDSITNILDYAFYNCSGIINLTIPNSVTKIGGYSFKRCSNLKSIIIPKAVTSIGPFAFDECSSLESIIVDDDNQYFSSENGVLFNKTKTSLRQYPMGKVETCYAIPDSVTYISAFTFTGCSNLTSIILPNGITNIGFGAFLGCSGLTDIWYIGTEEDKGNISIDELNNAPLLNANWHYVEPLKFAGASLTLQENLAVNYKIDKALIDEVGYTNPYVVFELGGEETVVKTFTEKDDRYLFSFRNISPNQMNDTIYATLYATYNGELYQSETREYSVAEYCYNTLGKYAADEYAELRTLLVDLLHYGAQSQLYTEHNTENLVNANLTDAQLAWGTSEDVTLTNALDKEYAVIENPLITWKGASLNLKDSVAMKFKFIADSISGLSLKVVGADKEWTINSSRFVLEDGVYSVRFGGLNAGQMNEKVYITMYKNGVPVSNTVCYSIESYAYSKQNSTIEHLSDLVKAMMRYGDSAKIYAAKVGK